uniref:Uncharacterized protein n=1 Tax=Cucumis melo TaxID=3656 RepID=A0A9I9EBW7_CUCME
MVMTHEPCCKSIKAISRRLIGVAVDVDGMSPVEGCVDGIGCCIGLCKSVGTGGQIVIGRLDSAGFLQK